MLAFENDSHFELEAEIAILKRTCARPSCFSYVELLTDRLLLLTLIINILLWKQMLHWDMLDSADSLQKSWHGYNESLIERGRTLVDIGLH
jgi:hypothetical protein